jgi:hypothetical protein
VDVLGADGTVETITGTIIHPVWSVDRQEWVPLAELAQGERLCCDTESFGLGFPSSLPPKASGLVLSVSLSRVSQPVYNIEVHGEHVYQVGELGLLVHNADGLVCRTGWGAFGWGKKLKAPKGALPAVTKAVNSDIIHAAERAVERGVFGSLDEAKEALKALGKSFKANGLPPGTIPDPKRADSVLVPFGNGFAVYEIMKNGTAVLRTVLGATN